jgi:hypothetical protein
MADTTTTNYGFTKPSINDPAGDSLWGQKLNANFDSIDAAIKTASQSGGGSGFPTAFNSKSASYTVVNGDANALFTLTGSGTLNLPSAASFGANKGIYIAKVDGAGFWAVTPASGTIDTLSSIRVYQERFGLVSDGTNWRSVDRPKGWVSAGRLTLTSGQTSVLLNLGFGDPEITDTEISGDQITTASGSGLISYRTSVSGTLGTSYATSGLYVSSGTPTGVSENPVAYASITRQATSAAQMFRMLLKNINAAVQQVSESTGTITSSSTGYAMMGVTSLNGGAALDGISFMMYTSPTSGTSVNFGGGTLTQKLYRP